MKKLLSVCMFLAAIALTLLTLSGCGEQFGTLQGVVTQMQDPAKPAEDPSNIGPAIDQATVVIYSLTRQSDVSGIEVYTKGRILQKMLTDAAGAFSFSLSKGKYVVEVWVEGYTMAKRQVEVKGGRTTQASFNVPAAP